jgi:nitroimidazol reductase NimA-like FMN-containing flavoprotein (pyridoxamine 5'-phosphate oxidase superfamily)
VVDPLTATDAATADSADSGVRRGTPGATPRTRVHRLADKAVHERSVAEAVLDAGLVAQVAVVDDAGQPYVVPVAYARADDEVVFHGSTASRLFRALATGAPTCLTVTLLDGMVVARSVFESSMHYRSVMVLGRCRALDGAAKTAALQRISDHLEPGRWDDARRPSPKELAATLVLALPLDELSVKVSDGPPDDAPGDLALDVWAGVVPLREVFGEPTDAPGLRPGLAVPAYVRAWRR